MGEPAKNSNGKTNHVWHDRGADRYSRRLTSSWLSDSKQPHCIFNTLSPGHSIFRGNRWLYVGGYTKDGHDRLGKRPHKMIYHSHIGDVDTRSKIRTGEICF